MTVSSEASPTQVLHCQELPLTEFYTWSRLVWKASQEQTLPESSVEKLCLCVQNSSTQELLWVWHVMGTQKWGDLGMVVIHHQPARGVSETPSPLHHWDRG